MKVLTYGISMLVVTSLANAAPVCPSAALTTYINGGSFFACTENGGNLTVEFNHDLLPSYVGLSLLSTNNIAANPAAINVIPGNPGLEFDSAGFSESTSLLSSQAELVHFLLDAGQNDVTETTLHMNNVHTSVGGGLGLGTGLVVGQEILCVGGAFTSLPTGLVTSVTNGLLGTGAFGCNGTAVIGTVSDSSGPLNIVTSVLGLPNLTGLTDTAMIQLSPVNQSEIDVIKLQAIITALGGTASDTGFGNTYALSSSGTTPEPGSQWFMLVAGVLLLGNRLFAKYLGNLYGKFARMCH
jgi:hypothetical protein